MANVIKTVLTYQLDGSTRDFNIPFEYLARKFVVVTLIGVDRKVLTLNTDYRFATRTTISLTKAWGTADGYTTIELRRVTSTTDRLVDFTDGSILRAYDLNVAQIQTMHVAEEARDLTSDTIGVNNDGHLDARGRRIVNVADGIAPGDAVTIGQMDRWTGSASNSADRAKVSETNAKTSETNAKTSEINSKASETLAEKWASNPEDTLVSDTYYSALHYSHKAAASAAASSNSAAAAANSADAALTSEQNAQGSADAAKIEADKLSQFNTLVDRINSVAVSQVGNPEIHVSRLVAKPGTVYADGQLLRRDMFPVLWEAIQSNQLPVTTEAIWLSDKSMRGHYTTGDGVTTFRIPDYNGAQSGSIKAPTMRGDGGGTAAVGFAVGSIQESALPNIKGRQSTVTNRNYGRLFGQSGDGAFFADDSISGASSGFAVPGAAEPDAGRYTTINIDAKRSWSGYTDGLTEVRVAANVIVWVIRTHGVVNNPGSVDAAVLASRVEQVYTELLTRMVANENREKSGQKFLRRVFDYRTYGNRLGLGVTVTLPEDVLNKMLVIAVHESPSSPTVFRCSPFIQPNTTDTMAVNLGNWRYILEFPSTNQIKLSFTEGAAQEISYIDVVCDYQQT